MKTARVVHASVLPLLLLSVERCDGLTEEHYDTREHLLSARLALQEYEDRHGTLPADFTLLDEYPFNDGWQQPISYELIEAQDFQLRSAGPDRTLGTQDDVVWNQDIEQQWLERLSGCYEIEADERFGDEPVNLQSVSVRPGHYSLVPLPRAAQEAYWTPVSDTVLAIRWVVPPDLPLLLLAGSGDTFRGSISWSGHWPFRKRVTRPATAVRVDC